MLSNQSQIEYEFAVNCVFPTTLRLYVLLFIVELKVPSNQGNFFPKISEYYLSFQVLNIQYMYVGRKKGGESVRIF